MERLENQGKTVMLVAYDRRAAGLIAVADRVKVGSAEAIPPSAKARDRCGHDHRRQ